MDLADGRVLRHQDAVTASQVGDVAQQHDRARRSATFQERNRLEQHRDLAALDLLADREPHAECALDLDLVTRERERALAHHAGEPFEHADVVALELAGTAAGRRRSLPSDYADAALAVAKRDALDACPLLPAQHRGVPTDDLAAAPGPRDERPLDLVHHGADEVARIERLTGVGPDLREHDEA